MQKPLLRCVITVVLAICILCCLTACSSSSVEGTWIVKEYRFGDNVCSKDNVSEMLGEDFATLQNDSTITFHGNGKVDVYSMGTTNHGTYSVDGDEILIYDEDGILQGIIPLVNQNIEVDFDTFVVVYEKK